MTDDLDQLRERTRQNRAALSDETGRDTPRAPRAPGAVGRTPAAGDRVLDRITGQEGIVEMSSGIHGIKGSLIAVRLLNGSILLRPVEELVIRPTPPTAGR